MRSTWVWMLAAMGLLAAGCSSEPGAELAGGRTELAGGQTAIESHRRPTGRKRLEYLSLDEPDHAASSGLKGEAGEHAELMTASQEARVRAAGGTERPLPTVLGLRHREVVRQATLELRVRNLEESERALNGVVRVAGGYLDSVSSNDLASANAYITMVCRIPVGRFEETIGRFERLGTRISKTVSAQDVTAQVVDYDARLRVLRAQEQRALAMLRATRDASSIMEIEGTLSGVRTQIESIEGQRKSLAGQAALSTMDVTLRQGAVPFAQQPKDANWFVQARGEASAGAFGVYRVLITALLWLAFFSPLWLAAGAIGWLGYRQYRRLRPVVPPAATMETAQAN